MNRLFQRLLQANLLCIAICLLAFCVITKSGKIRPSLNKKLSQELIFKQLAGVKRDSNICRIYVSPILKKRNVIPKVWEFIDPGKQLPAYFNVEQPSDEFKLLIPDSLANWICYIYDGLDVEHSDKTIYFYSALFPTKKKNIFAMEVYRFETLHEGDFTMRLAYRDYYLYTIKNKKAQFEESVSSEMFSLPILRIIPYKHKKQ
ncbi:MAG: hypothetical protein WCR52_19170 [Bacteroidota bacterium]